MKREKRKKEEEGVDRSAELKTIEIVHRTVLDNATADEAVEWAKFNGYDVLEYRWRAADGTVVSLRPKSRRRRV